MRPVFQLKSFELLEDTMPAQVKLDTLQRYLDSTAPTLGKSQVSHILQTAFLEFGAIAVSEALPKHQVKATKIQFPYSGELLFILNVNRSSYMIF